MIAFANAGVRTASGPPDPLAENVEALGDEIARLSAHLHAATYRLLVLIRDFDDREGWAIGFRSCAHWLSWRTGIAPGPAREKVRVARALAALPQLSAAMARGEFSYSMLRALTRVATPENEGELEELARHATAAQVETLVRGWRRLDRLEDREAELENEAERHQCRFLHLFPDDDGSWVLRGRLDPEVGAVLEKALMWASEALYRRAAAETGQGADGDGVGDACVGEDGPEVSPPSPEQRRADALGLLAELAMRATEDQDLPNSRADRFQVVVSVTREDMEVGEGEGQAILGPHPENVPAGTPCLGLPGAPGSMPIPRDTARRIACDAGLVETVQNADGGILDMGRKRRTVPPALRRALDHRDGGCRFPGCGVRFIQAHHIHHWADGGETKLDNLASLCKWHHRAVHEGRFSVEVVERGENRSGHLRFLRPDGTPIQEVPVAPPVPVEAMAALVAEQEKAGTVPDPWTPTPLWNGEPLDLGLALDCLRPPKTFPQDRSSHPSMATTRWWV